MRIVFMGTPDFSVPCLEKLIEEKYDVVGVVTQPDRPKGRKREMTPPPVKVAAQKHGIPVFQPEKIKDADAVSRVLAWEPDLIVTAAYGQIIPSTILDAPRYGCINVHASLLPKYRGGAPIHRAIIEGEAETGITIMYMVEKLDAGDILTQEKVRIEETDTVGTLHDKLSRVGADLLIRTIPPLVRGELTPVPQNEEESTFAPNIRREDEKINWSRSATEIYNQIRGLNPWPVAFTSWQGKVLKVWAAKPTPSDFLTNLSVTASEPGEVLTVSEQGIIVNTGDGAITLTELQPEGKRRMPVSDFVRGTGSQLTANSKLGE